MTINYKYVEIPENTDAAIKILEKDFMPLFDKYWDRFGKPTYNVSASFNIQGFIQMWMFGGLALVGAYEGDKMIGYLLVIRYTPMAYRSNSAQIEQCYAETDEVKIGMLKYFIDITPFMEIKEIWTTSDGESIDIPWTKKNTFTTTRYVK